MTDWMEVLLAALPPLEEMGTPLPAWGGAVLPTQRGGTRGTGGSAPTRHAETAAEAGARAPQGGEKGGREAHGPAEQPPLPLKGIRLFPVRPTGLWPEKRAEGSRGGVLSGPIPAGGESGSLYAPLRRAMGAAEHLRREARTVVLEAPEAGAGREADLEELDRAFRRDARRYDGGFFLY